MNDNRFPVTVAVTRPDGSVEHVRVGTAVRQGDGFSLQLGELTIGRPSAAAEPPPRRSAPTAAAPPSGGAPSGMVFPPYGRSKGAPIAGATVQDLEYYASGARRTLGDPAKSRWHEKERQLLAAIEAELARQGSGPPPASSSRQPSGYMDDDAPPHTDDDTPF